jgi:hypothetical protein
MLCESQEQEARAERSSSCSHETIRDRVKGALSAQPTCERQLLALLAYDHMPYVLFCSAGMLALVTSVVNDTAWSS